ncbi:hypothetical protein HDU76_014066 [Blyttiomyces sp. JEL0837]|nr:hypothetical protein HDU76_014066 [Blyttiomyces sp. JEL0837]
MIARKQWSALQTNLRNMGRMMWLHFPDGTLELQAQKMAAMRLLIGLAFAVKHDLRGEHGTEYEDLKTLLPGVMETQRKTSFWVVQRRQAVQFCRIKKSGGRRGRLADGSSPNSPTSPHHLEDSPLLGFNKIPNHKVRIAHILAYKNRKEEIPVIIFSSLQSQLNSLIDNYSAMERILTTRIPRAYGLHIRQVVTLFCLVMPFQVVDALKWHTITLMSLVAFTLFGVENLGLEIENPFGYDSNDLPLDRFCETIRAEIEDFMFNPSNNMFEDGTFDHSEFLRTLNNEVGSEIFNAGAANAPF